MLKNTGGKAQNECSEEVLYTKTTLFISRKGKKGSKQKWQQKKPFTSS